MTVPRRRSTSPSPALLAIEAAALKVVNMPLGGHSLPGAGKKAGMKPSAVGV